MRFALFQLPCYRPGFGPSQSAFYADMIAQARFADQAGWSRVYVSEHHFHYYGGSVPNPAVMLTALAYSTRQIRLASGISLLPFHHPLAVAEDYAMLDQLSGGRLDFGIGRGYLPHEFAGFGIPMAEQQERFEEGFNVIRRAWTGETFAHDGRFFRFARLALAPKPMQAPVPILVAASRTRESFEFAGRNGYGLMMNRYPLTDEQVTTSLGWYLDALRAAGHRVADKTIMISLMTYLDESWEEAFAAAEPAMREHVNCFMQLRNGTVFYDDYVGDPGLWAEAGGPEKGTREFLLNRAIIGSADHAVAQVQRYHEMGFTEISFVTRFGALTAQQAMRTLERLERDVRPRCGL
jgi:natural product biosynthesis luciferase-like monooxygenase protein